MCYLTNSLLFKTKGRERAFDHNKYACCKCCRCTIRQTTCNAVQCRSKFELLTTVCCLSVLLFAYSVFTSTYECSSSPNLELELYYNTVVLENTGPRRHAKITTQRTIIVDGRCWPRSVYNPSRSPRWPLLCYRLVTAVVMPNKLSIGDCTFDVLVGYDTDGGTTVCTCCCSVRVIPRAHLYTAPSY